MFELEGWEWKRLRKTNIDGGSYLNLEETPFFMKNLVGRC